MLRYHEDSDILIWDETGEFGEEQGWAEVSEEVWAVERAIERNLSMPDAERHLAYLRDLQEIIGEIDRANECRYCAGTGWFYGDKDLGLCGCGAGVSDPADPYWEGL